MKENKRFLFFNWFRHLHKDRFNSKEKEIERTMHLLNNGWLLILMWDVSSYFSLFVYLLLCFVFVSISVLWFFFDCLLFLCFFFLCFDVLFLYVSIFLLFLFFIFRFCLCLYVCLSFFCLFVCFYSFVSIFVG